MTGTRIGTVGGTLLTIFIHIDMDDLWKTAVFATIGATVSFFVSLGLKNLIKYLKNQHRLKW